MWDRFVPRAPTVIEPEFKIIDVVHRPPTRNILDVDPSANAVTTNWSGAVQTPPPAAQTFTLVEANWVVPAAYPPASAKTSTGWTNGTYYSYSWVGIDGYFSSLGTVLQAGTASVIVVTDGAISSTQYWGWHEWFPAGIIMYSNFTVSPGDLMSGFVCGAAGATQGIVCLTNLSTNETTGMLTLTAPPRQIRPRS